MLKRGAKIKNEVVGAYEFMKYLENRSQFHRHLTFRTLRPFTYVVNKVYIVQYIFRCRKEIQTGGEKYLMSSTPHGEDRFSHHELHGVIERDSVNSLVK